jgi:hypothetical protein
MNYRIAASFFLVTSIAACNADYIRGTMVEDTAENRQLVDLMDQYKQALENKDLKAILALASPKYYDNSGTPDPKDDINFDGLEAFLNEHLSKIQAAQIDFFIQRIVEDEESEGKTFIEYRYHSRYQIKMPSGEEQWHADPDVFDRLTLIKEGGAWRILSGL